MALRGDLVGEAYIRITADTHAMRDAISRDGKKTGADFAKNFSDEVERVSDARLRGIRQRLASGLTDTKDLDLLAKKYDNVTDAANDFRLMVRDLNKAGEIATGQTRKYITTIDRWEKSTIAATRAAHDLAEQEKVATEAKRIQTLQLNDFFRRQTAMHKAYTVAVQRNAKEQGVAAKLVSSTVDTNLVKRGRFLDNLVVQTDKLESHFGRFNTTVGKAFGKGSRNNFVNWVGSMIEGLTRLGTEIITFPFKAVAHIGKSFGDAFSASKAAGFGTFSSLGRGLLGIFGGKGGLVGTIAGAGVGLFAIAKLLPGIVSLMTMLGGVVTALAGSISIGLVGGLLAVAPAAVGAAAGLGGVFGVIATFANDKKNKDFMDSIFTRPLKRLTKELTPEIKTFLQGLRGGFKRLLSDVEPGITKFFDTFQSKMKDRTTQSALDKWSTSLGRIAVFLNSAVTSFASGLLGFFVPVLPFAEKLATWVDRIAHRFDEWANSKSGRNAIGDFMKEAWTDAKLVWDILKNIGSIIGTVFSSGDTTGQTFLTGIRDKLKEIDGFLKTPEGRSKLDNFFGDVKDIGDGLGDIAVSVGDIIKNFNTPEARESAKQMMDSLVKIGDLAEKMSRVADAIGRIVGYLINPALAAFFGISGAIADDSAKSRANAPPASSTKAGDFTKSDSDTSTQFQKTVDKLKEIQTIKDRLKDFVLTISLDDALLVEKTTAIENYVFQGKTIPISGNDALWQATKGTIAAYVFDPKTVPVSVKLNGSSLDAVRNAIRTWLNSLPSVKRIRVAGVNAPGGTTFDNSAAGRIVTGPNLGWTGEGGHAEAIVPLDRPLGLVDPAVRALSAFAQGKMNFASGGIAGASTGRVLNIHAGAIVVQTPMSNPALVAEAVLDRLVAFG